jgi:hypothetical protein
MEESHILLLLIIVILITITLCSFYETFSETLNNDEKPIYYNNTSYNDETDLLVPTKDMEYNPYDVHRPANELPHQVQNQETDTDKLSTVANTSGDIPIVYSHDELSLPSNTPTVYQSEIDAGSGNINTNINIHNSKLNSLQGIN